ncbi:hypothetical protein D3C85_877980 [compost metagenome]
MSDEVVKTWQRKANARKKAESWQALPRGSRYMNDTFSISEANSKAPVLVRAGQKEAGGKNYWETEEDFNKAILSYLVKNWESVYPEVLEIMKKAEQKALQDCQEYVTKMQELINSSENS